MAMSQHQIQYNMLHLFGEYILKSHPNIAWAGITSEIASIDQTAAIIIRNDAPIEQERSRASSSLSYVKYPLFLSL